MDAKQALSLTHQARKILQDDNELKIQGALDIISAAVYLAAEKGLGSTDVRYTVNPSVKSDPNNNWIGEWRMTEYQGTWPDCLTIVGKGGIELCRRISELGFSADVHADRITLTWAAPEVKTREA